MVTMMSELPIVLDLAYEDIAMDLTNLLLPDTLIEGGHYIYVDRCYTNSGTVIRDVQFVAYTSCPAIVVVLDGSGKKVRILRDDLYTIMQYTTWDNS